MIDIKAMNRNDPVVIIDGPFKGRLGYFLNPYPYPDGDKQCMVEVAGGKVIGGKTEKVLISINELLAIETPLTEFVPTSNDSNYSDYKIGQRVIITKEGTYRGVIAVVLDIHKVAGGSLIDYDVEPIGQDGSRSKVGIRVREEDLVPADYSRMLIHGMDVGKWIKRDSQEQIALNIYEDALKSFVDEILKRRTIGNASITDYILAEVAKKYCEDLAPKYQDEVLQKIKDEIAREVPEGQDDYGFYSMFTSALGKCAEDYITSHPEEIQALMIEPIKKAAGSLSTDFLATALRKHVDIKKIVREAFCETTQEGNQ